MVDEHKPLRVIVSNKNLIPNLEQKIQNSIQRVGGPKKMEHLLIRKMIIAKRIFHEKFAPSRWADARYDAELAHLRQELRRTRS